jgi:predicted transcriptional regulator
MTKRTTTTKKESMDRAISLLPSPLALHEPPEGYFSVRDFVEERSVSESRASRVLNDLFTAGEVDRVLVANKNGGRSFYYGFKNKK